MDLRSALSLQFGLKQTRPIDETADLWEWMRDPLPPQEESMDFELLRRSLKIEPSEHWISPEAFHKLRKPDLQRIKRLSHDFFPKHNPFIRHIVRRTRDYLENTIDPHTHEPYLQRVAVRLFGESDPEAINLPPFLRDAYDAAEEFCTILARRHTLRGDEQILFPSQVLASWALRSRPIMNLICEVLFVYRYLPDRRKNESTPLCSLSLCGEPDFKRRQFCPKTPMKSEKVASNYKGRLGGLPAEGVRSPEDRRRGRRLEVSFGVGAGYESFLERRSEPVFAFKACTCDEYLLSCHDRE